MLSANSVVPAGGVGCLIPRRRRQSGEAQREPLGWKREPASGVLPSKWWCHYRTAKGELRFVFAYRKPEGGYDVWVRDGKLSKVPLLHRCFKRWENVRKYFERRPSCAGA